MGTKLIEQQKRKIMNNPMIVIENNKGNKNATLISYTKAQISVDLEGITVKMSLKTGFEVGFRRTIKTKLTANRINIESVNTIIDTLGEVVKAYKTSAAAKSSATRRLKKANKNPKNFEYVIEERGDGFHVKTVDVKNTANEDIELIEQLKFQIEIMTSQQEGESYCKLDLHDIYNQLSSKIELNNVFKGAYVKAMVKCVPFSTAEILQLLDAGEVKESIEFAINESDTSLLMSQIEAVYNEYILGDHKQIGDPQKFIKLNLDRIKSNQSTAKVHYGSLVVSTKAELDETGGF